MELSEAKLEFEIRYYWWAISEWEKEINESFPNLRLFKAGSFQHLHQFMQNLDKEEHLVLAHALLNRFHSSAVKKLGVITTEEEIALLEKRDKFCGSSFQNEMEELQARRRAGEKIKFVSKTKLRKIMADKFTKAYGERCVKILGEGWDPWFEMKFAGWIVPTGFTFGRSESMISYSHSIGSEAKIPIPEFPPEVWPPTMRLGLHISFGSWLGICNRTQWEHLLTEDVEPACDAVLKLCGRFFDVAPKLLKGLEFETIKAS
jgi:hypothetical protein